MSHRVIELHHIVPIATIPSVLHHGILSDEQAAKNYPPSLITPGPQIPKGLKLHQYARLYFDAHNPVLFNRKTENLCVLRVSTEVFDIEGVVLTDQHASSPYARYLGPHQIGQLNFDPIFSDNWEDPNQIQHLRKKAAKCAEVLVPVCIPFCFISGAYVPDENSLASIKNHGFKRESMINLNLFFL